MLSCKLPGLPKKNENAAIEIARSLAEMDSIENSPLGQYLKKLADRAVSAKTENLKLKDQASSQRPGAGPIKKTKKAIKTKKQKNLKGASAKGQEKETTPAPKKPHSRPQSPRKRPKNGQIQEIKLPEFTEETKRRRNNSFNYPTPETPDSSKPSFPSLRKITSIAPPISATTTSAKITPNCHQDFAIFLA